MGGIGCALFSCGRIGAKDRGTELSAGLVFGQRQTGEQPGQGCATQDASDAPEGLAARGRGGQRFGQFVKG